MDDTIELEMLRIKLDRMHIYLRKNTQKIYPLKQETSSLISDAESTLEAFEPDEKKHPFQHLSTSTNC